MTRQRSGPRVSVIIPTYNRAAHLERSIRSVFNQTVDVHEVLLIDDGSSDGTPQLIRALDSKYPEWNGRLRYFSQENLGKSVALNVGLRHASGDWIAFNDSDDEWLPEKLELQFTALAQYETAIACFTDVQFVNNPSLTETALQISFPGLPCPFGLIRDVAAIYGGGWPGIFMQSFVVAKSTLDQFGEFDESIWMAMDADLTFRLGLLGPICYVNRVLVEVDRTEPRAVGLTTEYPMQSVKRLQVHERLIGKWRAMIKDSRPRLRRKLLNKRSKIQSALANRYLVSQEFGTARAVLRRAALQNPRPWVLAKYLWCVVAPRSLRAEIIRREKAAHP